MKNEKSIIHILHKYDFVRPADEAIIKANVSSKNRVFKKIMKQQARWSFGLGYGYTLFSLLRNFGFSISINSARRFAHASFAAASFLILLAGGLTLNNYFDFYHPGAKQPFAVTTPSTIVPISGLISFVIGDVTITDSNGNAMPASAGNAVSDGMKITTSGKKSFADIFVGENSFRISGDSSVEIVKLSSDTASATEQVQIHLVDGLLYNKITRKLLKGDEYSVKTASAVAAVRGTEFAIEEAKGKTVVSCLEGKVSVNNNAGTEITIEEKEEAAVTNDSDPVKSQIDTDRFNKLKLLSDIKVANDDIRKTFEQQRTEIQQKFEEQKAEIQKAVDDQKNTNEKNVADQKAADAARVEEQKAVTSQATNDINTSKDAAQQAMDAAKAQMEALKKKPAIGEAK